MIWRSYVFTNDRSRCTADVQRMLYSELNRSVMVVAFGGFPKSSTCLLFLHWNLVSGFPIWKNVSSLTTAPIQPGLASAPCVGVEGWADVPHGTLSHREWLKWAPRNGRLVLKWHMTASISFTKWESNLLMEDIPLFSDKFASGFLMARFYHVLYHGGSSSICLVGWFIRSSHWPDRGIVERRVTSHGDRRRNKTCRQQGNGETWWNNPEGCAGNPKLGPSLISQILDILGEETAIFAAISSQFHEKNRHDPLSQLYPIIHCFLLWIPH